MVPIMNKKDNSNELCFFFTKFRLNSLVGAWQPSVSAAERDGEVMPSDNWLTRGVMWRFRFLHLLSGHRSRMFSGPSACLASLREKW